MSQLKEPHQGYSAFRLAGAFCAFCIGSGFATGQEVMQFFTAYGLWSFGALGISMILFMWLGSSIMKTGYDLQLKNTSEIFKYYCGPYLSLVFEFCVPFFLFAVFVIMLSGASSIMHEHYGLPAYAGRAIMAIISLITVVFGLNRLVGIIGLIGPVIIFVSIIAGAIGISYAVHSFSDIPSVISSINVPAASSNWLLSGLLYAGFMIFGSAPFFAGMGSNGKDAGTASFGGILGGFMLIGAAAIMSTGILLNIAEVYNKDVPALAVSTMASGALSSSFAIVLLLGVYTTAAPMLWTVCNRIAQDGSRNFQIAAVVLTGIAFFGAQLPFGQLVGMVYGYTGYLGILFMLCIVFKQVAGRVR